MSQLDILRQTRTAETDTGLVLAPDGANGVGFIAPPEGFTVTPTQFTSTEADWAVNVPAAAIADPSDSSVAINNMAQGVESGVGFTEVVPPGITNVSFRFEGRALTAPGSTLNALMKVYTKPILTGSWSSGNTVALPIPSVDTPQSITLSGTLATFGLTADATYQFNITRDGASGSDTLVASVLGFLSLRVQFT